MSVCGKQEAFIHWMPLEKLHNTGSIVKSKVLIDYVSAEDRPVGRAL